MIKFRKMYFIIFLLIVFGLGGGVIATFLYYFPQGYIPNQTDGMLGLSRTIKDSKEKGLYVEELNYEIRPDTINLLRKTRFFVERTHTYDFNSSTLVKVQCVDNDLCLQINYEPHGSMFEGKISMEGFYYFNKLEDTLTSNLILLKHNGESFERYKIGELRLFRNKY